MPAEHVAALCTVLGEETRACAALTTVLREEQRAMIALRPGAILACLEQRQELEGELGRLADRRRTLVRDAAGRCGVAAGTVTDLLPHLAPDLRETLAARVRALRGELLAARTLERQNGLVAASSLEGVNELLRALQSAVPGARYDADARVDVPRVLERVDRRA